MTEYELQHFGILGQKWGIRRYQNPDGTLTPAGIERYSKQRDKVALRGVREDWYREEHTIPKGTKFYRVTSGNNQKMDGPMYVTYVAPDRNTYKTGYIRQRDGSDKTYEHIFTAKEDIRVPSREENKQVVLDVVNKNKKLRDGAVEKWARMVNPVLNLALSYDKKSEEYKEGKKFLDKVLKSCGNWESDQLFFNVCVSYGVYPELKNQVIKEFKKRGYNAMADEAGIVGFNGATKEGIDPLIVFDGGKSFDKIASNEITSKDERKALFEDRKWMRSTSRYTGKWSSMNNDNNLQHFGILGQKWGVRRYQNPDGTLTPAGKARLQAYREQESRKVSSRWAKVKSKEPNNAKEYDKLEKVEQKHIANMSYHDMLVEKTAKNMLAVGGAVFNAAISGGVSYGIALLAKRENPALYAISEALIYTALRLPSTIRKTDRAVMSNRFKSETKKAFEKKYGKVGDGPLVMTEQQFKELDLLDT